MTKSFSLLLTLILLAFGMVLLNCGNDHKPIISQQGPQTSFAFLQETPGLPGMFTPALGTFTVNGGTAQFAATLLKDPGTGQTVSGEFWSIILSPDGKKAAFDLYGGLDGNSGHMDVWVANSDGTGIPLQVTNNNYDNFMAQFSPDGTKIVFLSNREQRVIETINVDGTGEAVLPIPAGVLDLYAPTYSPDGLKIGFQAWGYDENDVEFAGIFVMNTDGSNPQMLTNPFGNDCSYCWDEFPSYTADGSKIVFSRDDASSGTVIEDVYIMNADGTEVTKLSDGVGINSDPLMLTIKGLDERILFSSNRDNLSNGTGGFEIYSMTTQGAETHRLTNNSLFDGFCIEKWVEQERAFATQYAPGRRMQPLSRHQSRGLRW